MANSDWIVLLEAVIDNSSLTNAQKKIAKEHFAASLDVELDIDSFAKSKKEITENIVKMSKEFKKAFDKLNFKVDDKQLLSFTQEFLGEINKAAKAQEKLNQAQKNHRLEEQAKYYKRIIDNNKEIYKLQEKRLTSNREETREINRQITNLKKRNKRAYDSISQKGLGDTQWGLEVSNSEKELKNRLAIKEANLQDKANAQEKANFEKQIAEYNKQELEYQKQRKQYEAEGIRQAQDEELLRQSIEFYEQEQQYINIRNKALEEGKAQQQAINEEVKIYSNLMNDADRILEIKNQLNNGHGASNYQNRIDGLISDLQKYGVSVEESTDITSKLQSILDEMNATSGDKLPYLADRLEQEFKAVKVSVDQAKLSYDKFAQPVSNEKAFSLINRINTFLAKNTAISSEARVQLQGFVSILEKGVNLNKWNEIDKAFKKTENKMRGLGKLGASLSQQFQQAAESFTQWISVSSGIMFIVHQLKKAVSELKEIDTLITEISKANDKLSSSQLAEISDNSFDVASKYGKKATDYLSAVQESSRAGYKNAEAIAELSTAIQGAGDVTSDIANKYVIATDKAYGLKGSVEELTKVFDGSNYITNKNAVNMTELAEGMSIVGSTAASFGIEANETTAALGTMIATTQQSGSEMARAFRAVLLNIRQVSDEEEGIDAEGLTKYEEACNALGVSLKETRNGVLQTRDAMEVLKELSVKYNQLEEGDLRRTQLLNSVGGKSLPRYIEIYN